MHGPILKVNGLSFSYQQSLVLNQLSFSLEQGEIAAVIGVSGSGKTTLFKLITGMLDPLQGSITINNLAIPQAQNQVAYMTQEDLLLPWRTVLRNMTLTSELGKQPLPSQDLYAEANKLLDSLGLSGCGEYYPDQLSGGMRQRISLARALLLKRPLLLLDEPFGSLDVILRDQMYALLRKIHDDSKTSMLLITHDFRDALSLADRIVLMAGGKLSREWKGLKMIREDPMALAQIQGELKSALNIFFNGQKDQKPNDEK